MPSRVRTVLIFLLTLGLLAFFLRNADVSAVWAETRRARPLLLLGAVIITALTYVLRAFRWQYLLAPLGPTHFAIAFRATVIGFAASFLLPARAGEVIRPYLLARREGLPATAAFATIILERLLDLVTVLALFALFVLTVNPDTLSGEPALLARVTFGGVTAGAAAAGALIVAFIVAGQPERLGRFALRIERVLPPRLARAVATFVESFTQGLAVLRQPRRLVVSLLLSIPLWVSIAAGVWLTSMAFHITFPFMGSFLVLMLLVVGVAVPTPGAVGGFHAAYQIGVQTFFAASDDRAIGAAIVLHAISFLPVTALGLVFMARDGLTLSRARKIVEEDAAEGAGSAERAPGERLMRRVP